MGERYAREGDLVLALAFETHVEALRRRNMTPDLLLEHLLATRRVRRLLVADPWRSRLSRLRGRPRAALPDGRSALSPLRLRRGRHGAEAAASRYLSLLRHAAEQRGLERPSLLTTDPLVAAAAEPSSWRRVTYFGYDEWTAHPGFASEHEAFQRAYRRIRAHGHAVVGVSPAVVERIGTPGPSAVVPNGLDPDEWRVPLPVPSWWSGLDGPVLFYSGTLDGRLDRDVLRTLADALRARDRGRLVLVGAHAHADTVEFLRGLPRTSVLPWQDRRTVRALTAAADVALVPHVLDDLTRAMSPLKLYEYLAAGRHVVATALPGLEHFPTVRRARDAREFVAHVEEALAAPPVDEDERSAFIAAHSWTSRFDRLLDTAVPA